MDELGEHGERILEHARAARTPTTADRDRVKHALVARGLMGAAAAGSAVAASSTAAAATGGMGAAKLALVVGLVGVTVGGGLVGAGVLGERAPERAPVAAAPRVVEPPVEARAADDDAPAAPVAEASADADGDPAEEASVELAVPDEGGGEASRRRSRRRSSASSAAEAPSVQSLADELALLHRAQAARRTDPARALALVREHESRFPRSQLRAERTALHVLLLCDRGQQRAATRIARPFLRRTAPSPLRRSVQESCAGEPD